MVSTGAKLSRETHLDISGVLSLQNARIGSESTRSDDRDVSVDFTKKLKNLTLRGTENVNLVSGTD